MGLFSKKDKAPKSSVVATPPMPQQTVDVSKLKLQTKLAKNRIELQKNKYQNNVDKNEREIAQLLQDNQEGIAQTKAEQTIRDLLVIESLDILSAYVDLLGVRNNIFNNNVEPVDSMPFELREAVCSIIYASSRVPVEELQSVTNIMRSKYGAEAIDQIQRAEGPMGASVNQQLIKRMSVAVPEGWLTLQRLEDIAKRFEVAWQAPPEYEMLKGKSILAPRQAQPQAPPAFSAQDIPGGYGGGGGGSYGPPGGGPGYPGAGSGYPGAGSGYPGAGPGGNAGYPPAGGGGMGGGGMGGGGMGGGGMGGGGMGGGGMGGGGMGGGGMGGGGMGGGGMGGGGGGGYANAPAYNPYDIPGGAGAPQYAPPGPQYPGPGEGLSRGSYGDNYPSVPPSNNYSAYNYAPSPTAPSASDAPGASQMDDLQARLNELQRKP